MLLGVHLLGAFGNRRFLGELAHDTVKLRQVLGNQITLGIVPGSSSDPVARVDGGRGVGRLCAEISVPCMVSRALSLCQGLTVRVGSGETSEVPAFAKSLAGDEEARHRLAASHRNR